MYSPASANTHKHALAQTRCCRVEQGCSAIFLPDTELGNNAQQLLQGRVALQPSFRIPMLGNSFRQARLACVMKLPNLALAGLKYSILTTYECTCLILSAGQLPVRVLSVNHRYHQLESATRHIQHERIVK